MVIFGPLSYFFVFFVFLFNLRVAYPGWGILFVWGNFFVFPWCRGFWALCHPRRIATLPPPFLSWHPYFMPNMTGRPGYRTMEMIGGSSAPYLARTPCVPLFCTLFNRGGNRRAFRLPGAGGDHFHCTVEPSPGHIRCRIPSHFTLKEKFMNFAQFLWILVFFFLGKTSTIHIELLFRFAPGKSSWTGLSLVWFAGATPDYPADILSNLCGLTQKSDRVK